MTINYRDLVLNKLNAFLSGDIPQEKIYEWALAMAVSPEYEVISRMDPLVQSTIQAIMDINHGDQKVVPSGEDLEYLRACLEGKAVFEPLEKIRQRKQMQSGHSGGSKAKENLFLALRIYVVLFAVCSIVVNGVALFRPQLFQWELGASSSMFDVLIRIWPHVLYAVFLLIPLKVLTTGSFYFFSLLISGIGIYYYCFITVDIIFKLSLNVLMILVIAPFSFIPAMVILLLLLRERKIIFAS